jgi:DNA mismatch repair protein MutS2
MGLHPLLAVAMAVPAPQVACFCGTSMAAEELQAGRLPLGASQAESELLLQQTQEAMDLGLLVTGA